MITNQQSGGALPTIYIALVDKFGQIVGSDNISTTTLSISGSYLGASYTQGNELFLNNNLQAQLKLRSNNGSDNISTTTLSISGSYLQAASTYTPILKYWFLF